MRYQSTKGNWKKAVDRAEGLIVAAGGDGTVAKVFRAVAGRNVHVAVLAMGTANNVARSLGLLGNARDLVSGWDLGATRRFDVWTAGAISGVERRFVESCGGGVFVAAIERGQEVEKSGALVGSEIDRALALLREIVEKAPPAPWHVEVDGTDYSGDYIAVEALNIRLTGPGVPLAPDAKPDDGALDVALVTEEDRGALVEYLQKRLKHEEHAAPVLHVARGTRVLLGAPAGTLRIDDELLPVDKEIELTQLPGAVTYLRAPLGRELSGS